MSISYVLDTWIHDFQFSQWFIKVGIINFILKIRRLRHREVKWFAQGHIVDKWQSWELKTCWEFNSRLYSLYINKHPSDQLEIYVHFYYDLFFPSFPEINIIMKIYMYSPFLLLVLHYCIYTTFIKTHTIFFVLSKCVWKDHMACFSVTCFYLLRWTGMTLKRLWIPGMMYHVQVRLFLTNKLLVSFY